MIITPEYLALSGTEDGEQSAFFCFATNMVHERAVWATGTANERALNTKLDFPFEVWSMLYAVPNGGNRDPATAARLKATGVKSGFPDIGFPVARRDFNGLFIEMKRADGRDSDVKKDQLDWHLRLRAQGYCVAVCYGWRHAAQYVFWYLGHPIGDEELC